MIPRKFTFKGSVYQFGKYICNWQGETFARSEAEARNNLLYQFKKKMGVIPSAGGYELIGKVSEV